MSLQSSLSLSTSGDVPTFHPCKLFTQWGPQVLSKTRVLVLVALLTKVEKHSRDNRGRMQSLHECDYYKVFSSGEFESQVPSQPETMAEPLIVYPSCNGLYPSSVPFSSHHLRC